MSNNDNIFRKIIRSEVDSDIVYQDDEMIAFKDLYPAAPLHLLIIPKKYLDNLNEATNDDALLLGKMLLLTAKLARDFGVDESGYRTVINTNAAAGQTVPHLHIHLLAERNLGWPPG